MPETTPLIKAALNLRGGAGFDVYLFQRLKNEYLKCNEHNFSPVLFYFSILFIMSSALDE